MAQSSLAIFLLLGIIHIGSHIDARAKSNAFEAVNSLPPGTILNEQQEQTLVDWDAYLERQFSSPAQIQADIEAKNSGYIDNFIASAPVSLLLQTLVLLLNTLWDVLAMMLLGMAFLKWGLLDASRSSRDYCLVAIAGIGLGLPLNYLETVAFIDSGYRMYWAAAFRPSYDISRLSLAVAYIALVMLICKQALLPWLRTALAAVGQMALTNYLAQTIICNFIFMGFGMGLFGDLQRYQAYLVVLAVWAFQIVFSLIWLRYYRFGPAEWLWRSLSYKKSQPLLLRAAAS